MERNAAGQFISSAQAMAQKALKIKGGLKKEIMSALYIETEVEVTEVKQRTPVRYGNLQDSVHQVGPTQEGNTFYSEIVAGGPSAPYAFFVHENLEAFHKVGQAKFLESVILESRPHMAARIARRIELRRAMA